jgi:sensor domain CHASE-containing protein
MLGATMWIVYGVLLAAPPVIAANALLIGVAAWTVYRSRRGAKDDAAAQTG